MPNRIVTIETRLNNTELINYFEKEIVIYNQVKRKIWHEMTNPEYKNNYPKESVFTKHCRVVYGLHSRTINSIITEVKGLKNAYMELKETELKQLNNKIESVLKSIKDTKSKINELKKCVIDNKATKAELIDYRYYKNQLFVAQRKLNKLNMKQANLKYIIDNKIYKVCFGSKSLFNKQDRLELNNFKSHEGWYNKFVKERDKNIYYLGANNESFGNQTFQLQYIESSNDFTLKVRKDHPFCTQDSKYITVSHIDFPYRKEQLKNLLQSYTLPNVKTKPISYRIHRENNKWYLQAIFKATFQEDKYCTSMFYGVIGLDFNNGFIELAETNKHGNLINIEHIPLNYHGKGNAGKTELAQKLSTIFRYAIKVGKDVVAENLDFKYTKSKTRKAKSKKGKNYNQMTHTLDYSRYKSLLENIAFNNRVNLILINPKNTSKIAEQKYCKQRNLTPHQGAALVIARRGRGFKDKFKQTFTKSA